MKFEPNDKYNTVAVYALIVIFVIAALVGCAIYFDEIIAGAAWLVSILKPLIYGFIFAFMLFPLQNFLQTKVFAFADRPRIRKKHLPRVRAPKKLAFINNITSKLSSLAPEREHKPRRPVAPLLSLICTYLAVAAALTLFVSIIIPQIAQSYTDLSDKLGGYVQTAINFVNAFTDNLPKLRFSFKNPSASLESMPLPIDENGRLINVIVTRIDQADGNELWHTIRRIKLASPSFDISETLTDLLSNSYRILTDFSPRILTALGDFITEAKNILLGLIISVYYLAARKPIVTRIKQIIEVFLPKKSVETLYSFSTLINDSFIKFINGKLIDAVIIGLLCFLLMTIFRMPYAPIIGLLVGVTNIIPYLGPFLGAVPGAFIIFVSDPFMTIWFVLLIIGLQQLDSYIIEPYCLRSQTNLDSVFIIISVIVMGGFFGLVGLLIGVPVFAIIYKLLKEAAERRLSEKGLPVETSAWAGDIPRRAEL